MGKRISLNNKGYDPFIDFLKGVCIIWVVLTHSMPSLWKQRLLFPLWGGQAVPLFLLIQSYHYFKHDTYKKVDWSKLLRRIVLPFAAVQSVCVIVIVFRYYNGSGMLSTPLSWLLKSGGNGPGSYYFCVYLQFALILLPLSGLLFTKIKVKPIVFFAIFAIISEVFELICSVAAVAPWLYRLLAVRYVFLVFGGYIWAKEGIELNWKTIALSLVSVVMIFLLQYRKLNFEPWVFDNDWRYFHWFCYFLAMYLLFYILHRIFVRMSGGGQLCACANLVKLIGKYSYQIFLFQMLVFEFFPSGMNKWLYMLYTTLLSIVPIAVFSKIKEKWQITRK